MCNDYAKARKALMNRPATGKINDIVATITQNSSSHIGNLRSTAEVVSSIINDDNVLDSSAHCPFTPLESSRYLLVSRSPWLLMS